MSKPKTYKISQLGKVVTGTTPSSKHPEDFGFEIPFVTPSDYRRGTKYISTTERYLSSSGSRKLSSRILPANSVMVTCIGSDMGKVALSKASVITNQQVNSIICNSSIIDPHFLYYLLKSEYQTLRMYGMEGTAVPIVNKATFESIELTVPDLRVQQLIAEVLSSFDDKIDLLQQQNRTLENLGRTLFREWFVKQETECWEEVKISDVCKLNPQSIGKTFNHSTIEYLDTGSITNGFVSAYQSMDIKNAPSRAQRLVRDLDIVYSLVRPNHRHYGILQDVKENTVVSTGFCVIRTKNISPFFIYVLLTSDTSVELLHSIADGSTSAYPSLRPEDIGNFTFSLPPEKTLHRFDVVATDLWKKMCENEKQILTLQHLRNTLLPKLISGEVRLKDDVNEVPEMKNNVLQII